MIEEDRIQKTEIQKSNVEETLQASKTNFFDAAKICLILITTLIVVLTVFMCIFPAAHFATEVKGVEAKIECRESFFTDDDARFVHICFYNANKLKVTVDFFVTHKDRKISKRMTILLDKEYQEEVVPLYKDIDFDDIYLSRDEKINDLEINMTVTYNSKSYFGFCGK